MKKNDKNNQLISEMINFIFSNSTCMFILYEAEDTKSTKCINESLVEIKQKKRQVESNNQDNIANGLFVLFCIFSILIIGTILNKSYITFWFLITFIPLRSFVGGVHANTRKKCYIYSMTIITGFLLVIQRVPNVMIDILLLLSLLFIAIIAPIESKNNELSLSQSKKYKKISHIICVYISILYVIGRLFKFFSLVYAIGITGSLTATLGLLSLHKTNGLSQLLCKKKYSHRSLIKFGD